MNADSGPRRDMARRSRSAAEVSVCRVFVSYARVDEVHRLRLDVHLAPLVRAGLIELFSDRAIAPGAEWARDIENELALADVFLLLVTPDFVASVDCFEKELVEALRRHEEESVRILPVLVKSVDLKNLPFGRFQGLPDDLRPISAWPDADEAWLQVAQGVRQTVEDIYEARTEFPVQRTTFPAAGRKSELGNELREYYGAHNCVVDGPVSDVEWIPLNEDTEDMRFENVVPISGRHRIRSLRFMAGTLQRVTFRFGIDLVAERLFLSARRHYFHDGHPALAFGCTRLGDVLAVHYPYMFEAHEGDDWAFVAQSLFYLPYRMHAALLEATLLRIRKSLALNNHCPSAGRAVLLLALANLYQDTGGWAWAEQLYDAVLASHPASYVQVATIRRRAVGRIFLGQATERDFHRVGDYGANPDLAVSLAMSQGWWHLANGRPEQCLRELEPFNFDEESPYSPHNAVEFKLTWASALSALGLPCDSQLRHVRNRPSGKAHLRPVFTEYIAPLLLARHLRPDVEALAGPSVASPTLDATAAALLAAPATTVAGRLIWVD
jgi:hypothetical protein